MAQNVLNYEGLYYFLSKLAAYINNKTAVNSINTDSTNGIGLSIDANKQLGLNVTPGLVSANNTLFVTGGDVFNAIENNYFIVTGTYNNNAYTADKTALAVYEAALAGKKILLIVSSNNYAGSIDYYSLYRVEKLDDTIYFAIYINIRNTGVMPKASDTTTWGNAAITFFAHSGTTLNTQEITLASLISPTFTGIPKAPTAELGTNNTQIATTAFVTNTVANAAIGKATFQGAINSETDLSSLSNYTKGSHWLVLTAGTYVGQACEVGDLVYCIADKNGEFKASDFTVILNNLDISIITNELIDALFE